MTRATIGAKVLVAFAFLGLEPGVRRAMALDADIAATPIEDPRFFDAVRRNILRPVVSGLSKAQQPIAWILDEGIYRVMQLRYKGRIHEATPQMGRILAELAAANDRPGYPWRLLFVNDPAMNVFSTSNGRIYLFAGLLGEELTEADLAGILAHEMAHTLRRHMVRRFEFSAGAAAVSALVSLGLQNQLGPGAQAVMPVTFWLEFLAALQMNRNEETEADEFGTAILRRSSFSCMALPQVLEKLAQRGSGASARGLWKYLQTHPPAADRIHRAAQLCAL